LEVGGKFFKPQTSSETVLKRSAPKTSLAKRSSNDFQDGLYQIFRHGRRPICGDEATPSLWWSLALGGEDESLY